MKKLNPGEQNAVNIINHLFKELGVTIKTVSFDDEDTTKQ